LNPFCWPNSTGKFLRALNYAGLTAVANIFKEFLIVQNYFITRENKALNNMNGKI